MTEHPTAAWNSQQQLVEAFCDGRYPRFLGIPDMFGTGNGRSRRAPIVKHATELVLREEAPARGASSRP